MLPAVVWLRLLAAFAYTSFCSDPSLTNPTAVPSLVVRTKVANLRVVRYPRWMVTIRHMLTSSLLMEMGLPLPIRLSTVVSTVGSSVGFSGILLVRLLFLLA